MNIPKVLDVGPGSPLFALWSKQPAVDENVIGALSLLLSARNDAQNARMPLTVAKIDLAFKALDDWFQHTNLGGT